MIRLRPCLVGRRCRDIGGFVELGAQGASVLVAIDATALLGGFEHPGRARVALLQVGSERSQLGVGPQRDVPVIQGAHLRGHRLGELRGEFGFDVADLVELTPMSACARSLAQPAVPL